MFRKVIKSILLGVLILITLGGIIFSIIYADLDDAPPFSLVGSVITVAITYAIYRLVIKRL